MKPEPKQTQRKEAAKPAVKQDVQRLQADKQLSEVKKDNTEPGNSGKIIKKA